MRKIKVAGVLAPFLSNLQIKFRECMNKCMKPGFHIDNIVGGEAPCRKACKKKYLEARAKYLQGKAKKIK